MPSIPMRERGERMDGTVVTPLRRTRSGYSQESIGRYSEHSLHSAYRLGGYRKSGKCQDCMSRIPYATLIATIMCCLGVLVFCAAMYRGAALSSIMFDEVFHIHLNWLSGLQLGFVIVGASMGALGIMILFVGCLATGATRHKVYRTWRGRVGGRISCAVFMTITYILQLVWIGMLCFLVVVTLIFSVFWGMCTSHRTEITKCINFEMFDFMFPANTPPEKMKVCNGDIKLFCKDCVELAGVMFVLATVACIIILLSLVHYLMSLSANYAHIRDHEKFQELQELQYLQDPTDMSTTSKDRF